MAKGDNAILPLYDDADKVTCAVASGAAVSGGTFVVPSGGFQSSPILNAGTPATDGGNIQIATCGAGAKALGVAAMDAPTPGDKVLVFTGPGLVVPMVASGTVTAGQEVMSDANGKPTTWAFATSNANKPNGIAVSTATDGNIVYIRLH